MRTRNGEMERTYLNNEQMESFREGRKIKSEREERKGEGKERRE